MLYETCKGLSALFLVVGVSFDILTFPTYSNHITLDLNSVGFCGTQCTPHFPTRPQGWSFLRY